MQDTDLSATLKLLQLRASPIFAIIVRLLEAGWRTPWMRESSWSESVRRAVKCACWALEGAEHRAEGRHFEKSTSTNLIGKRDVSKILDYTSGWDVTGTAPDDDEGILHG